MPELTKQSVDFSQWYQEVIKLADLAQYSKVKGCMIIKPYGYALWELIQAELDRRIKRAGVKNVYFPLFIPESFLTKEKKHVEGFAPECAVVTHGGGKKLAEPLIVRPTSETVMYDTFSDWIKSYRDLPLMINQWANVVRWEMRTRLFLRTTEFLWQEGHTAHATKEEADKEAHRALKMYEDFDREFLSIPVRVGRKSAKETFAGALYTLTTEALARDGKAIQAGTSHNLGQGFAHAFTIQFQNERGEKQYVWQTSWGLSTRIIGTLIMVHGDDHGLRLPPSVAPYQIVIVPIWKDENSKKLVRDFITQLQSSLDATLRVHVDDREEVTPGFKFNEWEVKGVPLRIEVGPRDVQEDSAIFVRRDTLEKTKISSRVFSHEVNRVLSAMQHELYNDALQFQKNHTLSVSSLEQFKETIEQNQGFFEVSWCERKECEDMIQKLSKATCRLLLEDTKVHGVCFACGRKAKVNTLFAKAY